MAAVKLALDKLTVATAAATAAAGRRPAARPAGVQLSEQLRSVLCVLLGIFIQSILTWLFGRRT